MMGNEIFVFSPQVNGGRICAYRASKRYDNASLDRLNIKKTDLDFIVSKINSHIRHPLLVMSGEKPFLVSCAHYPSSRLCFGVIPDCSAALAKKLHMWIFGEKYVAPSFSKVQAAVRIDAEQKNSFSHALDFIIKFTERAGVIRSADPVTEISLSRDVLSVAEKFIECNTDVILKYNYTTLSDYDISLFSTFVLCSLLFAYNHAKDRSAVLKFFNLSENIASAFSFECYEDADLSDCFSELNSHMSALGMHFKLSVEGRQVKIEQCAVRHDLSLADLKGNPDYMQ